MPHCVYSFVFLPRGPAAGVVWRRDRSGAGCRARWRTRRDRARPARAAPPPPDPDSLPHAPDTWPNTNKQTNSENKKAQNKQNNNYSAMEVYLSDSCAPSTRISWRVTVFTILMPYRDPNSSIVPLCQTQIRLVLFFFSSLLHLIPAQLHRVSQRRPSLHIRHHVPFANNTSTTQQPCLFFSLLVLTRRAVCAGPRGGPRRARRRAPRPARAAERDPGKRHQLRTQEKQNKH
jgi:hypothetical protein